MNRRQAVDSDDESDNLTKAFKTTRKSVKGRSKTKNLQKTDTGSDESDNGLDSASSTGTGNVEEECSPKEEQAG